MDRERSRSGPTRRGSETDDVEEQRVELYVRSLAPCGTNDEQNAIVERLLDLERRGVVADVDLVVWGNAVCMDGASAQVGVGARVADRIRSFQRWCADRRASLEPFFTWSVVDASLSDDSFERVVPPHRCLAVYADDRLQTVYPRTVEGTIRSVEAGLRALERRVARDRDPAAAFEEVG